VWVARTPANVARIVSALRAFGFTDPVLAAPLFLERDRIVRMGLPPFRIEIATTISGVAFADCYPRRIETSIDGVPVTVIDLANLRRNQMAAGRHKDLDDLENLPPVEEEAG